METDDRRLTVREWAEDDRPREKMLRKGSSSLSDAELLAILIGSGSRNETVVELSRRILRECSDNLNVLARLSVAELCKRFKGIGEAKAITILAAMELGNRRKMTEALQQRRITSSVHLYNIFEPLMCDLKHEEFWIALLTNANNLIEVKRLTQGGTRQTVVDLPMLLRMAIERSASAIAVAHNHPSGQSQPSNEDDEITNRIKEGCNAVGIRLIDHIIVMNKRYYSYCDNEKI